MDWNKCIQVSFAVSDANRADEDKGLRAPRDLAVYLQRYCEGTSQNAFSIELQPEKVFVTHIGQNQFALKIDNPWFTLASPERLYSYPDQEKFFDAHALLAQAGNRIYVHQPCQAMDVISENPFKARQSIETAKAAMEFAQRIGAKVFDVHLVQQDKWQAHRAGQKTSAEKAFLEFVEFHQLQGYTFDLAIENLECPKFPCTVAEMKQTIEYYSKFFPKIKLVVDIPHLWRSQALILENQGIFKTEFTDFPELHLPFHEYLEYALQTLPIAQIAYFHMAGAYGIVTHGIPGVRDDENPFKTWIELNGSDAYYEERGEMNMRRVIALLIQYVLEVGHDLRIIMEIHNRTLPDTIRGLQVFRSCLIDRAKERWEAQR